MPSRFYQRQFYPDTYHHIFNRGAFKQKIFLTNKDYSTFLDILGYYLKNPNGKPLTKLTKKKLPELTSGDFSNCYQLLAYCLMPNHFHLLLLQKTAKPTIADLLKRVSITYAMYFQEKHQHSGVVFQGKYKSVQVKSGNQLLYLSKYIHLNPVKKTEGTVPSNNYSSYQAYINQVDAPSWLHPEIILESFFSNSPNPFKQYKQFILDSLNQNQEELQPVTID